jgi:hypothetical protein
MLNVCLFYHRFLIFVLLGFNNLVWTNNTPLEIDVKRALWSFI